MAGPFRIESNTYTFAAKRKTVETAKSVEATSPVVAAADKLETTKRGSPVVIIGILCAMTVAVVGLAIYKKNAKNHL